MQRACVFLLSVLLGIFGISSSYACRECEINKKLVERLKESNKTPVGRFLEVYPRGAGMGFLIGGIGGLLTQESGFESFFKSGITAAFASELLIVAVSAIKGKAIFNYVIKEKEQEIRSCPHQKKQNEQKTILKFSV